MLSSTISQNIQINITCSINWLQVYLFGIPSLRLTRKQIQNRLYTLKFCISLSYSEEDPKWLRIQRLREDGIKELAVAGPVNFLPWIRYLLPKIKQTMDWIIKVKFWILTFHFFWTCHSRWHIRVVITHTQATLLGHKCVHTHCWMLQFLLGLFSNG